MQRNKGIFKGLANAAGILLLKMSTNTEASGVDSSREVIITDHDNTWDYRIFQGKIYMRKKGDSDWVLMSSELKGKVFDFAKSKLSDFMTKKHD